MKSIQQENQPLGAGEQKIDEYVRRIDGGESKDSILKDLPEGFRRGIERKLSGSAPGETERKDSDRKRIQELREDLGIAENKTAGALSGLEMTERRKLQGWEASYELAKIAKQQEIDLSAISREEYVDFAISNSLAIDDDQLRVAPWQRMATSVEEIVLSNRERKKNINEDAEKNFARFSYETKLKAAEQDRFIDNNIRVRSGTKDSDGWLFFGINNGTGEEKNETYKSYISVKDLNTLTPQKFKLFMADLRDAGYNGDVKIFQDLTEQGVKLNDQIVMHGRSETDAQLGLEVAEKFFGKELDQKSFGKDEVVDGKNKSYSQILAAKIADAVKGK